MNNVSSIDFQNLPHTAEGFSKLYTDYLKDYQRVQEYFEVDFHSLDNFPKYAEYICKRYRHRAALIDILLDQNQQIGASELTLENIQSLARENTLAIVTGQQVGILGGPLYTIYKTITAIKLAQQLNASYSEYKFVPVFWLEGEDHDFEEMNHIGLLNPDHVPVSLEYLIDGKLLDKNPGAVGEIALNESIGSYFEQLQQALQNTEFKQPLIDVVRSCYHEGVTFNQAFASLMNKLFEGKGLVFINSNDRRVKKLVAPIFQKEILENPRVSQLIIERSAELEEKYHAQIKPKALNLFFFHKGGRYLIEPRENDFSLKGTRKYFQKDELLRVIDETPEMLSPNVALRPICQDTILPTLAYIGGPAEIAYFAQLKPVYDYFSVPMPIIYPRASATLVERRHEKVLEKYDLQLTDLLDHAEKVSRKVVDIVSEVKIDDMFTEALRRIEDITNEMKFGLNYIDPTLLGVLETTQSKIKSQLDVLKEKAGQAQQQRHEVALRQLKRVINSLYPNNNFQERELNVIYFMNKYGMEFVQRLHNEVKIDTWAHQFIWIG